MHLVASDCFVAAIPDIGETSSFANAAVYFRARRPLELILLTCT